MLCDDIIALGHVRTPYLTKFGVPRQPELARSCPCALVLEQPATCGLLEDVVCGSHLLIVWAFSVNGVSNTFRSTVRPPRLGGSQRVGVFASRSSFRPNALALSCVTALAPANIDENGTVTVAIAGADMVDGSPVIDVALYDSSLDEHENAASGWVEDEPWHMLDVAFDNASDMQLIEPAYRDGLVELLSLDPRPAYARSSGDARAYWVAYANVVVDFRVQDGTVRVERIERLTDAMRAELAATGSLSGRFARA